MASKPGMRKSLRPELFAAVAPLLANTDRLKRINDALYNGQWFPLITEVINFAKDNPEFANYARDNSEVITNVAKAYFESNPQMADRLRGWINLDMQILDLLPPLLQQIEKLKAINDHFNNGEWLPLATKALDLANQYPDTVGKALKVQSKVIADVAEGFCAQPHMQQQLQWLNFNPKVLKAIEPLLQQPARLKQLNDAFVNAMIVGQLPGIEALYQQLQQSHALPAANTSSQKLKVLDQYYKTSPHLPKEVAVRLESAHNFHDSIVLHGRLAALDIVDKAVPKPDWVQLASQAMSFVRQDPAVRHFVTAHTHMIGDIVRGIFVNSQILGVDRDNQVALQMVDIMLKHLDDLQVIIDTYASAGMVAAVAQFSATVRKLPELERFFAENADSIADMAQKIILSIPVAREQLTDRGINLSNMELLKEVVRNIKEFDSVAATKAGITNGLAAGARILVNNPAMRAELYSQVAKNVTGITVDLVGDQLQNTKLATLFGQDRSRGELTRFMLEQITREHQFQVKDQSTGLIDLNKSIEKLVKTKRDLTKLSAGNLKEIAEITKNTTLNNVVFKDYCIENMSFAKSTINNADFQGTDFRNVDFSHTVFKGKIGFKGATLDPETLKTLLPAVRAAREVFTRSAIVLDGVKLVGDFSGMDVSGISFQHADFSKAEITGANLANCNLTNAVISEQQLGSAKSLYETHSNIKHFRDIREKHVASDVVSKLADDVFGKASSRNKNQFKAKLEESLQKRLFKSENFQNKEKQDKIIHDVLATHESAVARDLPESQVVKYLREALPENTTEFTTEQMNVAVDVLVKNTVIDRLAVRLSHELFKGGETSNRKTDQQRIKKHLTEVFRAIEEEIPNFNYETLVDKEASIVGKLNFSVTQGGKLSEGYGLARLYYDHATTYTWAGLATGGVKTKSTIQATSNFKDIVKGHVVACLTITPKELECVENMANKVSENLFKAGYKTTRKVDAARIKEHLLKEVCKLKQEVGDGFNIEHLGKISRKVTGTLPSQARLSNPPSLTELYYQASSFTLTGMASGGICMPEKNLTENLAQQISKSLSAFYHGHEHEVSVQKQHSHARKQSQARE